MVPKLGDLRVWWIPALGGGAFHVPAQSLEDAVRIMCVLAAYDNFRVAAGMEPDYSNAGGLEIYEADPDAPAGAEWCEWESAEGDNIDMWAQDLMARHWREIQEANDA